MLKECSKCRGAKPLSMFNLQNGKPRPWCKKCFSEDSLRRYYDNPEKGRYSEVKKNIKKYSLTEKGRKARAKASREMFKKYPEKWSARAKVRYAVARGQMKKLPCEICGNERSQAHHDDYSKPYDVKWLCVSHHRAEHKRLIAAQPIIKHPKQNQ